MERKSSIGLLTKLIQRFNLQIYQGFFGSFFFFRCSLGNFSRASFRYFPINSSRIFPKVLLRWISMCSFRNSSRNYFRHSSRNPFKNHQKFLQDSFFDRDFFRHFLKDYSINSFSGFLKKI